MNYPRLAYVATGALLLPSVVISMPLLRSGELLYLSANWAILVLPQLLVVVLAACFPRLRKRFAPRALILVSALFLLFSYVTSLDPNGAMLWVFYFASSILLLVVLAAVPSSWVARGL
jgi:hypothetical protein